MRNQWEKMLSILLSAAMVFSLGGMTAFAAQGEEHASFAADAVQPLAEEETPAQNQDGQYELGSAEDMVWFSDQVNKQGNTAIDAILTDDIDLSETSSFAPIGDRDSRYAGTFDGDGHTVTLQLESVSLNYYGLFGVTSGASISNVTTAGSVYASGYAGGLAGQAWDGTKITNCINRAAVECKVSYAAGIVSYAYTDVVLTNCVNYGEVTGSGSYIAGVAGYLGSSDNTGSAESCFNYGTITNSGTGDTGGIAGRFVGTTLTNCGNDGEITAGGKCVGGIAGYINPSVSVSGCYNNADVTGTYYVGGVIGQNYSSTATVDSCYNTGTVTGTSTDTTYNWYTCGGVVGENENACSYTNLFNTGAVSAANAKAYALVGSFHYGASSLSNSYYLEGTAESAYVRAGGTLTASSVESKTAEEIMSEAFATLLTDGGGSYRKGCAHPVLTWENVQHRFVNGVCTVCGAENAAGDGAITFVVDGDTTTISYGAIDAAITEAKRQTFLKNDATVTAQFVLLSDLLGVESVCNYKVTDSEGYTTTGLLGDTCLYWRDDTGGYCTAVDRGAGKKWVKDPVTIEVALDHSWGEVTWAWADDYSSATASRTCTGCDRTETVDAVISIQTTEPTVREDGETVYTATATFDDGQTATDTRTVTIPAIVVDKTALQKEVEEDSALQETDYTSASWAPFYEALGAAETVLTDEDALQDAVDAALAALQTAKGNLVTAGDKTDLEKEVEADEAYNSIDYTAESWVPFERALRDAKALLDDPNASEEGVDAALAALKSAKDGLVRVAANKSVLQTAIDAAAGLTESNYTQGSWEKLEEALSAAREVNADEDATQSAVDEAAISLITAISQLEPAEEEPGTPAVDKSALLVEYTKDVALSENDYTAESWEPFKAALDAALTILVDDPDATQEEVDAALSALVTAKGNLQPAETPEPEPEPEPGPGPAESYDGVVKGPDGVWGYYKDNELQSSYTGVAPVKNENGWWYIKEGLVDFSANTVAKNQNGWWYVVGGKVQFDFTGLGNYGNSNGWWYINAGKVTFDHNGVEKNVNGWWYVVDSKVQFGFTGLGNYGNENGWWYINGGKVTFDHNGVDKNVNGWWYVVDSMVQFDYTGVADYKNANGWWYIANGKVDFTYTGQGTNKNGTWNVVNGKVQF